MEGNVESRQASVAAKSRVDYVTKCKVENKKILQVPKGSPPRAIVRYLRKGHGQRYLRIAPSKDDPNKLERTWGYLPGFPVGLAIAFKDDTGVVRIGWAKCNTGCTEDGKERRGDRWNRHVGIHKAIASAVPLVTVGVEGDNDAAYYPQKVEDLKLPPTLMAIVQKTCTDAGRYFFKSIMDATT